MSEEVSADGVYPGAEEAEHNILGVCKEEVMDDGAMEEGALDRSAEGEMGELIEQGEVSDCLEPVECKVEIEDEGVLDDVSGDEGGDNVLNQSLDSGDPNKVAAAQAGTQSSSQGLQGFRGLEIRALPLRSSDTSIRDGLFHQYKKYGKTMVNVFGTGDDRYAIVSFKKHEDAERALEESLGKVFFGSEICVTAHEGLEIAEDPEGDLSDKERDEFHPKATRALFVGNLPKEVSMQQLRDMFAEHGEIVNVEMKTPGMTSAYAFVQFEDISSVVTALREMDGKAQVGSVKLKLGFGKQTPTPCVWLNGIPDSINVKWMMQTFGRFGPVVHIVIDRIKKRALVFYEGLEFSQTAVTEMRGRKFDGNRIQIDFASRDFQQVFYQYMEKTDQLKPGDKPEEWQRGPRADSVGPPGEERGATPTTRGRIPWRGGPGASANFRRSESGRSESTEWGRGDWARERRPSPPRDWHDNAALSSSSWRSKMASKQGGGDAARREDRAMDIRRYEDGYQPGIGGYSIRRKAPGSRERSPSPKWAPGPPADPRPAPPPPPPPAQGLGGYSIRRKPQPQGSRERSPSPKWAPAPPPRPRTPSPPYPPRRPHSPSPPAQYADLRGVAPPPRRPVSPGLERRPRYASPPPPKYTVAAPRGYAAEPPPHTYSRESALPRAYDDRAPPRGYAASPPPRAYSPPPRAPAPRGYSPDRNSQSSRGRLAVVRSRSRSPVARSAARYQPAAPAPDSYSQQLNDYNYRQKERERRKVYN